MSDVATLGLAVDSGPVTSAAAALDKFSQSAAKSETVTRAIQAAADRAGISFDEMSKRVDNASSSTEQTAKSSEKASKATTSHATAVAKTGAAADTSGKTLGKLSEVLAVLEARELKLAGNMGMFGAVLGVIGPGALATAAGLGAIVVAMDLLVSSANRMGDLAQQLQNLSTVSGVSTTALQALEKEAVGFGLSSQQTGTFLTLFTERLDGVRKGSGALYDQLLKIDPALLAQLSVTKDSTTALNLLAAAYAKAGTSQNALATAAGAGRGMAGGVGLMLGDITSKGSVDGVVASVNQLDLLTNDQIKSWAKLKTQIDDAAMNAKNNIDSIFTSPVLMAEKAFYDTVVDISREMKGFALSDDFHTFMKFMSTAGELFNQVRAMRSGMIASPRVAAAPIDLSMSDIGGGMTAGRTAAGPAAPVAPSLAVQARQAADAVSFLGSAATAQDRYDAGVKKLNADVEANATLTGLQGRALAALGLDKRISEASGYVSALGEFATTQDKATLASLNFQKAMLTNSRLTDTQRQAVVALTAANDEWSRASNQAQLGIFNLGAATKAAGDQFKAQQAPGGLLDKASPEQLATAYQAYANKIQALGDAAKVAGSKFPQLTQLGLEAGNINKQFDQFATTSLNAVSPALQDMLNGTTSLSAGFSNLGMSIVKALEDAIIKLVIIKPLIDGLSSSLGSSGILGMLGIGGKASNATDGIGGFGPTVPSAHGNIFDGSNIVPFARGGVIDHPTLFKFASGTGLMGEAGPEAIVPLKRGADGNLGIASQGGGGSMPQITVNLIETPGGGGATTQRPNSSGGIDIEIAIAQITAKSAATPGAPLNRVLTDQLGSRQRLASR